MEAVHPLKAYRAAHGLKIKDVADQFSVRTNTVWRWENWKRTPEPRHLAPLAEMTGAPLDALIFKPEQAA